MIAAGTFEINLQPQADSDFPAGRMTIDKTYSGDLLGSGRGQMISKRTDGGPAVYYAVEEFSGSLNAQTGAFTLLHRGQMTKDSQSLQVDILEGSGSGAFEGISGTMDITQDSNGHTYELAFEI